MMIGMAELNRCDEAEFTSVIGGAFEHSPWIARRAAGERPFAGIDDLHAAMCRIVEEAGEQRQLELICAHPDLVGRMAREGRLTPESTAEQASAGLDRLATGEIEQFERYNAAYRQKFGFPFVICARDNRKESILLAFPSRLQNDRATEIRTALQEIFKIARLRLADRIRE
jgi:OHCU decarboxylase